MKPRALLLFVLLLPFTMAPRTSLNPDGSDLTLTGIISRTQMRPGSAVTFVVQARNATPVPLDRSQVDIAIGWDGKSDQIALRTSQPCILSPANSGFVATCRFGTLAPGEQRTVRVTARPLAGGLLTFEATGMSELAPVPAGEPIEVVVKARR